MRFASTFRTRSARVLATDDGGQQGPGISGVYRGLRSLGLAVPVLTYSMHSNSTAMQKHAIDQTRAVYESIGGARVVGTEGVGLACHNMGVARMSADPEEGVTNRWGQAHDVPNLFVSDGSVFTTSAAANPTLTIVALAIRQPDHIADRMRRGEL